MRWLVAITIMMVTVVIVAAVLLVPPQEAPLKGIAAVVLAVFGGTAAIAEIIGLLDRLIPISKRRETAPSLEVTEDSLQLYSHRNPPYNAVKMLYTGSELARDVEARVIYTDIDGEVQTEIVEEFFPEADPRMAWHYYKYDFLKPSQVAYFRLPQSKSVLDEKVLVQLSFVGAKTGKSIVKEKEFNLRL